MSSTSSPRGSVDTTEAMQIVELPFASGARAGHPGLVLLYARNYEDLAPAYALRDSEIVIGRDPGAGICVSGGAVSRQHARIHRDGRGGFQVTDLGGRNGTLVNGEFVREASLNHLDEVRVGDTIFKFVERDAESYGRYRIDGAVIEDEATGTARISLAPGRVVGGYQIQRIAAGLREVARSALSVLLFGESGTGKEVFAQQLHDWSGRSGPLQAVNCAAIPATLIEGELFGHRRGAFSGADRDRPGLIRSAHGGTLFLDEIGDMPPEAQAKLLRVIQSREVTPLGATQPERVDVRIVCATHRDIVKLQQSGGFRGDLFARLNEYSLTLPPLRARKEDLFALCHAFAARHGQPEVRITDPFMLGLLHYHFPFNVRELEALIKRWAATASAPELEVQHLTEEMKERMKTYGLWRMTPTDPLSPPPAGAPAPPNAPETRPGPPSARLPRGGAPSDQELRALLAEHRGNVTAVARLLGKDRVQVKRWMTRYSINIDEYR